jgi:predicted transposase YdaD
MRLDPDLEKALGRRLRTMNILKDSSFYQVLLEEGRRLGELEGRLKVTREAVHRLGRIRFGEPAEATRAAIEAIDDLRRLELLTLRILKATSWDDLLDESKVRLRPRQTDRPD